MNINLQKRLDIKDLSNCKIPNIDSLSKILDKYYNNLQNLKLNDNSNIYSVDRFEGDFAILENRKTEKISNVKINKLPNDVKEGSILRYIDGIYTIDKELTDTITKNLQNQFNPL